jgi:hypothetical protein
MAYNLESLRVAELPFQVPLQTNPYDLTANQ